MSLFQNGLGEGGSPVLLGGTRKMGTVPDRFGMRSYAELHCLTNFSFLRAASHPDELVARAAELGYSALAITDRHSVAGVVRAHAAARQLGLKLLIGAEVHPTDAQPVVLLATNRAAYGRLTRLLTLGKSRAAKGECQLSLADLAEYGEGLIACMFGEVEKTSLETAGDCPNFASAAEQNGTVPFSASGFVTGSSPPLLRALGDYRSIFGDRAYLLAEAHRGADDAGWLAQLDDLARRARVPLVAAGGVYYHVPERRPLHDALTAVRLGRTVAECGLELFANGERHLKPLDELELRYEHLPGTLARTQEVADRCQFSLDELRYEYPRELSPPGTSPLEYLRQLAWRGAAERYPHGIPDKVRGLLDHELNLIEALHYEAYFLTVWDLVRFARSKQILCQGRGSAANSAVCYCLGVTSVDPGQTDVLFERFISQERGEAPDIDVDFEHERREEVLQYLYEKYGRQRAAMTAEVISYRSRSAAREMGKALGLAPERIDAIAKTLVDHHRHPETKRLSENRSGKGDSPILLGGTRKIGTVPNGFRTASKWDECCRDGGLDPGDRVTQQFVYLVQELIGFPRHLSQHVGGMVMTEGPLCEMVPIENAAMPGRTVVEWNKDDLDTLGILKVDCLALGMLSAIRKCFDLVRQHTGRELTLANIPQDDSAVYDMICAADTIGVFQIESRAQMSMLPRLKPRTYYDLVIEVSIVRPGPIQGNMVHPYLRRRSGDEPIEYPNDAIRQVLEKTLGVPIFQEQAMRLAIVAAGFSPGEADQLRRAMAAWRKTGAIERFHDQLIDGMRANGLSEEFAARVYQQICGFGEYGFPESHAASFALLVYVSAWLKCHYPAAFCAAICNSQPMGFYAPAQLIRDAREHRVSIRPVDVNHSDYDLTLEPDGNGVWAVRLGLRMLSGLAQKAAQRIVDARRAGKFRSANDLARRAQLGQPVMELLARADALASLELDRRQALWQSLRLKRDRQRPLFDQASVEDEPLAIPAAIDGLTPFEEVLADYRTQGLSLRAHPLSFFRAELAQRQCEPAKRLAELEHGLLVRTAGLVLLRQRPSTAKGITFATLEDETGVANIIIRPAVWQRCREVARAATAWIVEGRLERHDRVVHIVASRLLNLKHELGPLPARSRDFR